MGPVVWNKLRDLVADLTDVTLAAEDTNSILTDNANMAFQGKVAMRVTQPSGQLWNQAMQVNRSTSQNDYLKVVRKTSHKIIIQNCCFFKVIPCCLNISIYQSLEWSSYFSQDYIKLISVRKPIQVIDSIPWVRCASGNVWYYCS